MPVDAAPMRRRPDRRVSRFDRPMYRVGLVAVATGFALVVSEGVARLVLPPPQTVEIEPATTLQARPGPLEEREQERGIDVLLDWSGHQGVRLHPNVRATIHNHSLSRQDVVIQTNSLGVRHPELGPKRGPRVLVLGDSITFGDYVAFDATYPAQLGRRLADRDPPATVINAGLPGASTTDEIYHYLELRDAVEPDLVLVGMYLNDAQNSRRFYARALPPIVARSRLLAWAVTRVQALRVAAMQDQVPDEVDPDWAEAFRAGRDLRSGDMLHDRDAFDFEIYNARRDFGLAWTPDSWRVLEPLLRVLAAEVAGRHERLGVMLFPVHLQVRGEVGDLRPQQAFARMCRSLSITCLDLQPPLRRAFEAATGERLFYDHCHLTREGNRVVADAIADWVEAEGLLDGND